MPEHVLPVMAPVVRRCRLARAPRDHHRHTELPGSLGNAATQHSMTNDADRHRRQLANRVLQHAKIIRALPGARMHQGIVLAHAVRQVQQHGKYVLDNRTCAICADIAYGDVVISRGFEIDVIYACCGKADETQAWSGRDNLLRHPNLVNENKIDAVDSRCDLRCWCAVEGLEIAHHRGKR